MALSARLKGMEIGGREGRASIETVRSMMKRERRRVSPSEGREVGSRAVGSQLVRSETEGQIIAFPSVSPASAAIDSPVRVPEAA